MVIQKSQKTGAQVKGIYLSPSHNSLQDEWNGGQIGGEHEGTVQHRVRNAEREPEILEIEELVL